MSLASHYATSRCAISFELFPPKTEAGLASLCENVRRLTQFKPDFFTCTYGAGGSTRGTTLQVLQKVREITNLPVASHLTCVGATVEQLEDYLAEAQSQGIPVVAYRTGGIPEVVLNEQTGYIIDSHSPEEFTKAIQSIMRDNEKFKLMKQRARLFAGQEFSPEVRFKQYATTLNDVIRDSTFQSRTVTSNTIFHKAA